MDDILVTLYFVSFHTVTDTVSPGKGGFSLLKQIQSTLYTSNNQCYTAMVPSAPGETRVFGLSWPPISESVQGEEWVFSTHSAALVDMNRDAGATLHWTQSSRRLTCWFLEYRKTRLERAYPTDNRRKKIGKKMMKTFERELSPLNTGSVL